MMSSFYGYLHLFLILLMIFKDSNGVRNVNLTIVPSTVNITEHAVLYCNYDLEGKPLYTVKWYRRGNEFYRYTETDVNKIQIFDLEGFDINLALSNNTQVYLRNISDFKHSGNFSCEVTDFGQPISTGIDVETMLVVQLPSSPPTISASDRDPLDYGDILSVNCSSPPSKPQATLRLSLNQIIIGRTNMSTILHHESVWSDLHIKTKLTEFFFTAGDGKLLVECMAQIGEYTDTVYLELRSAHDPVPERVSAYSTAASTTLPKSTFCTIILFFVFFIQS